VKKYGNEHYEEVARHYKAEGTIAKVQDHYPWASYASVGRWVKKAKDMGLLDAVDA
jgi:hypothetical protein